MAMADKDTVPEQIFYGSVTEIIDSNIEYFRADISSLDDLLSCFLVDYSNDETNFQILTNQITGRRNNFSISGQMKKNACLISRKV